MKKRIYLYISILVLAAVILLRGDMCLIRRIVGIPCPCCGMTRAYMALFRFDIKAAFFWHPLFWTVPFIITAAVFKHKIKHIHTWTAVIIAVFISVYIIRMITLFPTAAPMDFNNNCDFIKIYNLMPFK